MTDLSKSTTFEQLTTILGLCLELNVELQLYRNYLLFANLDGEVKIYNFTLDAPSPELEQAIEDLKLYKKGLK